MAATVKDVVVLYQCLKREWESKQPNLNQCGNILSRLKIALTGITFLPTGGKNLSKQELLIARDILEIGALWAVAVKDTASFQRYLAQLKCYYMDYSKNDLPESAYKFKLLGLNLLCLLSQNRLAEFHTELELLPVKELQTNVFLKHPVSLEQHLMEGSYNKMFIARRNVPCDSYNFFIDILLNTIRDDIADCIEKAYTKITPSEAARMLFFDSQKPIQEYAQKRGWQICKDNSFHFQAKDTQSITEVIPAIKLAKQTVEYARELEMIV